MVFFMVLIKNFIDLDVVIFGVEVIVRNVGLLLLNLIWMNKSWNGLVKIMVLVYVYYYLLVIIECNIC